MNAEILLKHLYELGVKISLTPDVHSLDLDAPNGILTLELLELLREHKDELVQFVFEIEEGEAIQWEGCLSLPYVKYTGDERLIQTHRADPAVVRFTQFAMEHFQGGEMEFMSDEIVA
jgi:hypothetical protein